MPCDKSYCLKQVNPDVPGIYFGIPFEYDENWLACWFCQSEVLKEESDKPVCRFARTNPPSK